MNAQRGLTLIEMVVVLSILTLLVGVTVPFAGALRDGHQIRKQKERFAQVQEATELALRVALMQDPQESLHNFVESLTFSSLDSRIYQLVSNDVILGGAGSSYLPYWFPDETTSNPAVVPHSVTVLWNGAWDRAMLFPGDVPAGGGKIEDYGQAPGTIVVPLTNPDAPGMQYEIKLGHVAREIGQKRVETANAMIRHYLEKFGGFEFEGNPIDPAEVSYDYARLNLIDRGFLNADEMWNEASHLAFPEVLFQGGGSSKPNFTRVIFTMAQDNGAGVQNP